MTQIAEFANIRKRFDGIAALDDFSCGVGSQELVGVFGPNGAGKTTFFNAITGFLAVEHGKATFKGRQILGLPPHRIARLGIARTFQELRLIRRLSVLDNVLLCFADQPGESLINVYFRSGICRRQEATNREKALALLASTDLASKAHDLAEDLSYGQQKLLSLVCCLATGAELLLLDEPVAGIAPEMIDRILSLIRDLPNQGRSAVIIEHNVDALRLLCHRLIFMDAGRKICEGSPGQVLGDPRVIEAYLD